jgi:hypothetical protein
MDSRRKQFLVLFISLLLAGCIYGKTYKVKAGDTLVYRAQSEVQDENGDAEIYSEHIKEKVKVKRTTIKKTEKVLAEDKGLKYGFPLKVGLKWGCDRVEPRNDNMYCYYVEKTEDVIVPAGTFKDCFKVVFDTLPDTDTEWYCSGVGVVKTEYHHHGTIINEISELEKIMK